MERLYYAFSTPYSGLKMTGKISYGLCVEWSLVSFPSEHYLGQEWLVRTEGSYLPGVYEEVVRIERAHTLTPHKALHIRANDTYTDQFGKKRFVKLSTVVV